MKNLYKVFLSTLLVLSSNAKAYIPDRCDWQDCEALANGESPGFGLLVVIVIGVILYIANSK